MAIIGYVQASGNRGSESSASPWRPAIGTARITAKLSCGMELLETYHVVPPHRHQLLGVQHDVALVGKLVRVVRSATTASRTS